MWSTGSLALPRPLGTHVNSFVRGFVKIHTGVLDIRFAKSKPTDNEVLRLSFVAVCSCRMFTDTCKRMRIMKSSEAIGLGIFCHVTIILYVYK